MKKILAILCAVLMLASLAAAASAEEAPQTTTITTTVPSTYVLTIPATVEIPYGEKNATIGSVKVTGRITNDQYVKVTAETTTNFCLVNDSDSSARISWGSGGHSAGYVPLFVLGVGAENFNGKLDNTDIPRQIEALMKR